MRAAAKKGLVFATDPTSSWACTIGGNIAENAGGKTAVLWGTAIDNILEYRIVMPDARVLRVCRRCHPLRKIQPDDTVIFDIFDAGNDVRPIREIHLSAAEIRTPGLGKDITNKTLGGLPGIQKEGCDGIITDATFILYPKYPLKRTFCLEFFGEDMEEAAQVICDIAAAFPNEGREALMALEHFDEEYIKAIGYQVKAPSRQQPKAVLLIDLVGHDTEEIERGAGRLEQVLSPYPDTVMTMAQTDAEAEKFWQDRKKMGAIARRTHAFKLNEDIVLPLDTLAEFASFVDLVNGEEDRENQKLAVWQIASVIEAVLAEEQGAWKGQKAQEAIQLTREALDRIGLAGKAALREERHLQELMRSLQTLLSEFPDQLREMADRLQEVRRRLIVIATHMHAGDGNVHVNIPVHANDLEMMAKAAETADAVMAKAVELGGVVSGEHGIGITKFKYLSPERLAEFLRYRAEIDPAGLMNPGKLCDPEVPKRSFTPSFSLLGLEARILQIGSLEELSRSIADCIRCGKCKPNCCVFYPDQNLFFHPRNKNLALAALIEAILYEAQRSHRTRFEMLGYLKEIADHCTICHKCLPPCPVQIDSGQISIQEREILRDIARVPVHPATRLVLSYLESRSRSRNVLMRKGLIEWGSGMQRMLHRVLRAPLIPEGFDRLPGMAHLKSGLPAPSQGTLADLFPTHRFNQMWLIEGENGGGRTVLYFPGCGSERLQSVIGKASLYVLLQSGFRVLLPPSYLCCGFPAWVNAQKDVHQRIQLRNTIIFSQMADMLGGEGIAACVVSCGTCMEALHRLGIEALLSCDIEDVAAWVLRHGWTSSAIGQTWLYHRPCHDSLDGNAVPLLERSLGCRLLETPHCCSEAGTLATSTPEIAASLRDRKREALVKGMSDFSQTVPPRQTPILLTNCPACIQGLGRHADLRLPTRHVAEELARISGGENWEMVLRRWVRKATAITF
jgi:FAD/FMN-containing dehydrogenase/Fe-S oxidoreductase